MSLQWNGCELTGVNLSPMLVGIRRAYLFCFDSVILLLHNLNYALACRGTRASSPRREKDGPRSAGKDARVPLLKSFFP
jgi:hypothetical protein